MKKIICLLLILFTLLPLVAAPEVWGGISLTSGRNYFSSELKEALTVNPMYNGVKRINTLGPSADIALFPFSQFRIGAVGSAEIGITIGKDIEGKGFEGYISRHFDNSFEYSYGLAYYQLFSNDTWGFFADARFYKKTYSFATSNEKNDKHEVFEITKLEESGINASIGFLAKMKHSYFKMGFKYEMPRSYTKNDGWRLDIFAGGGFCF
ncbi:hypothetical protein FYJ80_02005 [Spirochaetales bacterium NM-380-WT-3C1]|uniref:Uncharacterized protein n=1 Tax=Bullifex porci TaxID=2606638 RepID=A0A7X2TPL0_9SPIO|nr:hypothetical protein [Bullifex porci]MSU05556.1 hypothetical protein [Bullifex porci]